LLDARLRGQEPTVCAAQPATVGFERLNMGYFAKVRRQQAPHRSQLERLTGFDEVVGPLSDEAFLVEAERCFHCGDCNYCSNCWVFCPESSISTLPGSEGVNGLMRFQVDDVTCKGCGICVHECPRAAIVMEEELQ
jgi:formate dehydrogenase (NADP+) beta subunit